MDFPGVLMVELRVEEGHAEGLAGALLLLVEDVVRERASYALATELRAAVPELAEWQTSAPTLSVIDLNNLPPPSSGSDEDELVGILSRFQVPPDAAPLVASATLRFIASRLQPESARAIADAMPLLIGRRGA